MANQIQNVEMLSRLRNQRIHKANYGLATNITLDETLRPLWKLTHFSGILLDWSLPISNNNPRLIFKILRYFLIILSSSLLVAVTSFELMQLLLEIEKAPNIQAIIPNLVWFFSLLLATTIQLHFLRLRKKFQSFFKDWRQLEIEISHLNPNCIICKSKKMHLTMYAIYFVITLASVFVLGTDISNNPEASYFISTYPAVRQVVPLLVIGSVHVTSIVFTWILTSLGDFIPSFTYYHTALAVSCLENDVRALFDEGKDADYLFIRSRVASIAGKKLDEQSLSTELSKWELDVPILRIWICFEKIGQIVSRADSFFGSFVVYSQAVAIFFITAQLYSVLFNLGEALRLRSVGPVLSYTLNLLAMFFRFFSAMLISSQLHQSVDKFRMTLSYLLSRHWNRMNKGDREVLRSFLYRIQAEPLVASPLGFYKVTPPVFLSVVGVIISYVIVLMQSK